MNLYKSAVIDYAKAFLRKPSNDLRRMSSKQTLLFLFKFVIA